MQNENTMYYHIKVNLPPMKEWYEQGGGEGVWVIVTDEVKKAYDNDEAGTTYTGILDNDSWYYNGLVHGEVMPIEMRGEKRPVVPYSWLIEHFEVNKKEFEGTPLYDYL